MSGPRGCFYHLGQGILSVLHLAGVIAAAIGFAVVMLWVARGFALLGAHL